ncbi:MAG: nucleotidyltransferase family protein [Chlamydiales bacterium]|nr:nucleotidyltransferase family protein [Chlamydiales bacterium]
MEAIILAGGLGTRLKEAVPDLPKPLAPINGSAFLDILLKQLSLFQIISKAILAVGYRANQIIDHYAQYKSLIPLAFSLEETPLGTGGAIKKALSLTTSELVLILNGDSYLDFSLSALIHKQQEMDADIVFTSLEVEDVSRYGKLVIDKENNRILSFEEKSAQKEKGSISGGVYLAKRSIFNSLSFGDVFSLEKDLFPSLLQKKIYTSPCAGTFIDIGTPDSFKRAQTLLNQLA